MILSWSYFVLQIQYNLSSSSPISSTGSSTFCSPSGPIEEPGIAEVERDREAAADIVLREEDVTSFVVDEATAGVRAMEPSECLGLVFGPGLAFGFAAIVVAAGALGFGAG